MFHKTVSVHSLQCSCNSCLLNTSAGHCRLYRTASNQTEILYHTTGGQNQAEGPWPLINLHTFVIAFCLSCTPTQLLISAPITVQSLENSCMNLELGNSLKPSLALQHMYLQKCIFLFSCFTSLIPGQWNSFTLQQGAAFNLENY